MGQEVSVGLDVGTHTMILLPVRMGELVWADSADTLWS
ncbi:hypothetical protein SAMN05421870_11788 [Streptomyces qinglanensis]|uniref:Uncharacterized protein n=1 Tax=Streptomyces qinglanensis TaxID=943816 RepID=A0A1H9WFC8_9ACTN|nr:hypothetical protein SAMN05421870_11788 [Streptomyces qinglanensis]